MQSVSCAVWFAAFVLPAFACAQTVAEIPAPTVPTSFIDFDTMPLGATSVAAINAAGVPAASSIANIVLTPSIAAAGIYDTNAIEQALALTANGLEIIAPFAGFTAFDARIDLTGPCTEIGFGIGDWVGPMIVDFYLAGSLQTTFTTSAYATSAMKYFQMTGGAFDRLDIRASTTAGNWVIVDLAVQMLAGLFPNFTATPTTGASPLQVQFTDRSFTSDPGGIVAWLWDFDNDGVVDSTLRNPTHVYTGCGDFSVRLQVFDASPSSPQTIVRTSFIRTDVLTPSFTFALLAPPNVFQFTDTTTPTPTSWAWDFDNDGVIDSTLQNPVYSAPAGCFTSTVRLVVGRSCRSATTTRSIFAAPSTFIGTIAGGNGTTSATQVGNQFDVRVTAPEGIAVCGLQITPYTFTGPVDVEVYVTDGGFAGREFSIAQWRLVATGSGTALGGVFSAPTPVDVPVTPFYLPPGGYGMAVYIRNPAGTASLAYTNGPGGAPFSNADLTLHPNGAGTGITGLFNGTIFQPRLWNGGLHYSKCSQSFEAGYGFFARGCAGSRGVANLNAAAGSKPRLGSTLTVNVSNVPGAAFMLFGLSRTMSRFGTLPINGSLVGAPGCLLHVSDDANTLLIAASGTAAWSFTIPNNPALLCAQFYNQAAVLDPGVNALGFAFSDAAGAVLGN